ncbi:MAG: MBL fold metallo-hydrolase, partial [Burkholderiaceae bacterium]
MPHATDIVSPPTPDAESRPPRASATIVVVRDSPTGIEVLLSRRAERGDQNSGAWVFPGGLVDPGDREAHDCCDGLFDAAASARLGLKEGGLDYFVAAVRECFEESGLLFATDANGELVHLDGDRGRELATWREPLNRCERSVGELCKAFGLRLAMDRIVYLSHWLTPIGRPKRFDTRFFIAAAPLAQTAAFDGTEIVEQLWLRPADALARSHELKLMTPTQKSLEFVSGFDDVAALLAWASAPREVPLIMPRIGVGSGGMRPVLPEEPAWAELGRIDPTGRGTACYEIQPGVAVPLSARVIRVTANNGSMMTGPGTNTYLVGGGVENEWAVIDPGPLDTPHLEAILAAAPGAIRWIFVTHTHMDHSPATLGLRERTRAKVFGRVALYPDWQYATFAPDVHLRGGERFSLPGPGGAASTLRATHTPGHASNHICYVLEEEK